MADSRSHPGKRAGKIFNKGQDAQHKRPYNHQQKVADGSRNGTYNSPQLSPRTNARILDPKADHVQEIADHIGIGNLIKQA